VTLLFKRISSGVPTVNYASVRVPQAEAKVNRERVLSGIVMRNTVNVRIH